MACREEYPDDLLQKKMKKWGIISEIEATLKPSLKTLQQGKPFLSENWQEDRFQHAILTRILSERLFTRISEKENRAAPTTALPFPIARERIATRQGTRAIDTPGDERIGSGGIGEHVHTAGGLDQAVDMGTRTGSVEGSVTGHVKHTPARQARCPQAHFLETWDLHTTPPGVPFPLVSVAQPALAKAWILGQDVFAEQVADGVAIRIQPAHLLFTHGKRRPAHFVLRIFHGNEQYASDGRQDGGAVPGVARAQFGRQGNERGAVVDAAHALQQLRR